MTTTTRKRPPVTNAGALRYRVLAEYLDAVASSTPPEPDQPEPLVPHGIAATFHDVIDEDYWTVLFADPRATGYVTT